MATTVTDRNGSAVTPNVNSRQSGLSSSTAAKGPCKAASTTDLTKSGAQTINAIACVADDRVLLTAQTDGTQNGIWIVASGVWSRAADFNRNDDVVEGTEVRVSRGSNAGVWVVTNTTAITFDTTSITLAKDTAALAGAVAAANNGSDFADANATLRNLMSNGADILGIATTNLDNATGDFVDVTGSTGISAITLTAGNWQWVRFTGAPLITVGASLIGNNNAGNVQIEAGDACLFRGYTSSVVRFWHFPIRPRQPLIKKGATIASANPLTIPDGDYFHVSGVVGISDIDFSTAEDGRTAVLVFDGILTLTHHATTLILPGGASITTAAGDSCIVVQDSGDNIKVVAYTRASGAAVVASVAAASQAEQEAGSSTAVYVSPGRQHNHPSAAKAWIKWNSAGTDAASYNVTSITDNGVGDWTVNIGTDFSSANYAIALACGSTNGMGLDPSSIWISNSTTLAGGVARVKRMDGAGALQDPTQPDAIFFTAFGDQ